MPKSRLYVYSENFLPTPTAVLKYGTYLHELLKFVYNMDHHRLFKKNRQFNKTSLEIHSPGRPKYINLLEIRIKTLRDSK